LAAFLTMRPFEFIRTDVALPRLPVKLVGSVPGLLSEANGPTHQALEDVALMRTIPSVGIFAPADAEDLCLGLENVLVSEMPFYVRHNPRPPFTQHAPFELGRAEILREGSDVGILTYGTLCREAWDAAAWLEEEGVTVRLVNLRTLRPLDASAVIE